MRRERRAGRRRCWRSCCRRCATCGGSGRARWICAWSPPGGWTPTTSTALHVWDWAAGALIAAEAGRAWCVLPPPTGERCGLVVAAAPGIADALSTRCAVGALDGCGADSAVAGSAGAGVDLRQQRRVGGLGGIRAQAGQHRVDVVVVGQLGEVGADRQVDGVVAAVVLEQLGARRDQPYRGGGGPAGRTEADLALALSAGCSA